MTVADAPAPPDVAAPAASVSPPESAALAGWQLAALWLVALGVLLIGLGSPPVTRTQEARVVETAREMLAGPADYWVVPRLNGELRLKKPPLAYWASAASFALFGVNNFAGRLPGVLAAWATLGVVYGLTARVFTPRAGLLAAAMLLGSHLFLRHARLAETDVWALLFVTTATACFWRACDPAAFSVGGLDADERYVVSRERSERFGPAGVAGPKRSLRSRLTTRHSKSTGNLTRTLAFWHLGALAVGLAGMSKGGPAAFPLVFLVLVAAVERRPVVLWRFLKSGAILTGLLAPALWLLAVSRSPAFAQIGSEITNNLGGGDHAGPFWQYGPETLASTLPWTPIGLVVLWAAVTRWREDRRVRFALLWATSILGPLCLAGNKQVHYLVPLMPPLFVLTGWGVDEALSSRARPGARAIVTAVFGGTLAVTTAPVLALGAAAVVGGRAGDSPDAPSRALAAGLFVAGVLVVTGAVAAALLRRDRPDHAIIGYALGAAVALSIVGSYWSPARSDDDPPAVARAMLDRFGDAPYRFARDVDESLVWAMRRTIPLHGDADGPGVVVLARPRDAAPDGLRLAATVGRGKGEWRAYTADPSPADVP